MAQVYLVCEGDRNSLDIRLLDAVAAQYYGLPIVIEPGGGGRNPRIIRAWLEQRVPGDIAFLIHDRDYEPLAEIEQGWLDAGEKCLCWTAHEIENYLLESWVIHELFDEYRNTVTAGWKDRLPSDVAAIDGMLQTLAPRLFNDHMGRILCGKLRRYKGTLGVTELNVPPGIDPLAGSAAQWQAAIHAQIVQLQTTCGAITSAPEFEQAAMAAAWTTLEQEIREPHFLNSGEYRRELKGKRLLNLFWDQIRGTCGYPGKEDELTNDLVSTIRRTYHTTAQYTFADFDRLANRLRIASGGAATP